MPAWPSLLILNIGSSSIKAAVWRGSAIVWRQQLERLATRSALATGLRSILKQVDRQFGLPAAVAHRIVHGGGVFHGPARLTPKVVQRLRTFMPLAPLHMPANLLGVTLARRTWPEVEQWGTFDTSLYDYLPSAVRLYAIPLGLAQRLRIRKYGFHGISHAWAFHQACRQRRRAPSRTNAVTIHLGSGDSITRWRNGQVEDTSMGFTPLEGLTMATRSGDIDPMIPTYLQEHGHFSAPEVTAILQQRSGLLGLTGLRDVRDVLAAAGHPVAGQPRRHWNTEQRHHAELAIEMFVYDIQRYLSGYLGLLPRRDMIVFTGAVGQNAYLRHRILAGVPIAKRLPVVVIPADEERAIAASLWPMVHSV